MTESGLPENIKDPRETGEKKDSSGSYLREVPVSECTKRKWKCVVGLY